MKKVRFGSRKAMALCTVVALTLVQSAIGFSPARSITPTRAVDEPNLANELRTLNKYADDFFAYQKECSQLKAKASLLSADLDPVQRKSDDLKRRVTDVQNVIREVIRKFKAAKQWDELDVTTAAGITDPGQRAQFQQDSFKQLLEDAASSLNSHANEISIPVDNLRKKLTGRTLSPQGDGAALPVVLAAYRVPTPMKFISLACTVNRVRNGIVHALHGDFSQTNCVTTSCACDPGAIILCNPGSSCASAN